jgi:predicted DNA-binding protein
MQKVQHIEAIPTLDTKVRIEARCFTLDDVFFKFLALILQSGHIVGNELPLSAVFISKAGIGKSRLLRTLKRERSVYYLTDITPKFLVEDFMEKLKKRRYTHICIPDFTNITDSHSERTGSTVVSLLRNLTEEGISKLMDYGMKFEHLKDVRAGLITATTINSYTQFRTSWKKTGFLSRMLPFSFTHSPTTSESILDDIDNNRNIIIDRLPYKIKTNKVPFIEPNPELSAQFRGWSELLGNYTNSTPYRAQIQLNKLAISNAILRDGDKLTQTDVNEVLDLVHWINYKFEAI